MEENVLYDELEGTEGTATVQAKEKKKNKTRKVIATTTYFIAMLCLLAGLFVPLFNCMEGVPSQARMMIRYIPGMFNGIFGKTIIKFGENSWFFPYEVSGKFDFLALIGVLYAVVCVISLLMFIPILLGSHKKNTSARCALGVEVLVMLVTLTYIAYKTFILANLKLIDADTPITWTDYNFLLAFGGALLMAIIQTVSSKGSIGVSKVIALVLSVLGVIALLDITLFIPKLAEPFGKISESLKSGSSASFIGFDAEAESALAELGLGNSILGIYGIDLLIAIKGTIELFGLLAKGGKEGIMLLIIFLLLILIALFTVINLICDVIGLSTGKKYNKDRSPCKNGGSNSFALTRYILSLIFVIGLVVMTFIINGLNTGIYLWLLLAVLVISLINAAARTAVDNARYKKGAVAPTEEVQQRPVLQDPVFATQSLPVAEAAEPAQSRLPAVEPTPAYAEDDLEEEPEYVTPDYMPEAYAPVAEEPAPEEPAVVEPLSAPLEEQPEELTRTVYIYGGATDDFMETLTDNEKVEFVELFIKKSKGTVNGVPDYVIDGDNSEFFPAVFVHINRYRNIVSDALMTKMYKQLGKL